jgi:hypothetical protein
LSGGAMTGMTKLFTTADAIAGGPVMTKDGSKAR